MAVGGRSGTIALETAPPGEHVTRAPRKQSPARRRTGAQAAIRSRTFGARWRRGLRSLFVRGRLVDPWEPRGADQRCDSCAARNAGRCEVPARTLSTGTKRSSDTIRTSSSTRSNLLARTTHRTGSAPRGTIAAGDGKAMPPSPGPGRDDARRTSWSSR